MSLQLSIPQGLDPSLTILLLKILSKAIDGSVVPVFVDYTNQRVIIGGTSISAAPAKFEIVSGDLKIVTAGSGVIIPNRAGTQFYRLIMENDGTLSVDPL